MLLRYEDIAASPMEYAEKVYNFTGLEFEQRAKNWIQNQLKSSADGSGKYIFNTAKNPTQESNQLWLE